MDQPATKPMPTAPSIPQMRKFIDDALDEYLPGTMHTSLGLSRTEMMQISDTIYAAALNDLMALQQKDPAAQSDAEYIVETYDCFKAVMLYRVANSLYYANELLYDIEFSTNEEEIYNIKHQYLKRLARQISETAKSRYSIDIHPAARIGLGLAIDHGANIVIGETCEIGRDCHLLHGVILGARNVEEAVPGKRHPTIGNHVRIAGNACVLGPIEIGDHVRIGANCFVLESVPANGRVFITNQLQLTKGDDATILVYGIVPSGDSLVVHGSGLDEIIGARFIDGFHNPITEYGYHNPITECAIQIGSRSDAEIQLHLTFQADALKNAELKASLFQAKLELRTQNSTILVYGSLSIKSVLTKHFEKGDY